MPINNAEKKELHASRLSLACDYEIAIAGTSWVMQVLRVTLLLASTNVRQIAIVEKTCPHPLIEFDVTTIPLRRVAGVNPPVRARVQESAASKVATKVESFVRCRSRFRTG